MEPGQGRLIRFAEVVEDDVYVRAGSHVTLPDATLRFGSGVRLEVEGHLDATGTTFTSAVSNPTAATAWQGLYYKPGSSGTLDGVTIEEVGGWSNATLRIHDASPTVTNSDIINSVGAGTNGVYVRGASAVPRFTGTTIFGHTGDGVKAYYFAQPRFEGENVITENASDGVAAEWWSEPFVFGGNDILGNGDHGVAARGGDVLLGEYYYNPNPSKYDYEGKNLIQDNGTDGLYARSNSRVTGAAYNAGTAGENEVFDNGQPGGQWYDGRGPDAKAEGPGSVVYARRNWWGRPTHPDTTTFDGAAYSGTMYVDPMLQAPPAPPGPSPQPGGSAARAVGGAEPSATYAATVPAEEGGGQAAKAGPGQEPRARLLRGVEAAAEGRAAAALAHFQAVARRHPDSPLAALALGEAARLVARAEHVPPGLLAFLEGEAEASGERHRAWGRRALVRYHLGAGDHGAALAAAEALSGAADEEAAFDGLLARFYLHVEAGRVPAAEAALEEAEAAGVDADALEAARLHYAVVTGRPYGGEGAVGAEAIGGSGAKNTASRADSEAEVSEGFALEAYPNPARGRLTVATTGAAGNLRLRLYDVLGRRVATSRLVLDGGRQEVPLDVSVLPAGVYLLRASFAGEDGRAHAATQTLTVVR